MLDAGLKGAGIALVASLALLALAGAWALTTRTTEAGNGRVYRENLLTGEARFCAMTTTADGVRRVVDDAAVCQQSLAKPLDFSDRATPAPAT